MQQQHPPVVIKIINTILKYKNLTYSLCLFVYHATAAAPPIRSDKTIEKTTATEEDVGSNFTISARATRVTAANKQEWKH